MAKLLHLAVAVAMLVVSTCTTYLINKDVMDTAEMGIDAMNVMIGSASGGVLSMVIGVFIPLFVCEDYVSGTIRNIVTRGYSRLGIFSANLIAVTLATAVMTIACMAAGYLIGLIFSGSGVEPFDAATVKILLCQLAVMLAEGALFYAISTVLQKTGGSIAVCLVLPMVLTISGTLSSFDVKSADMKKALLTALGYFVVTSAGSFLAVMKREY